MKSSWIRREHGVPVDKVVILHHGNRRFQGCIISLDMEELLVQGPMAGTRQAAYRRVIEKLNS